jgi:hypothetical protein
LLRIGANIGTVNRRCALSRPVATAPIPYSRICGMKKRRNSVASSWTAARSSTPGIRAVYRRTIHGAARMPTRVTTARTSAATVMTACAERHASSLDRFLSCLAKIGTKTDVRTPPRISS